MITSESQWIEEYRKNRDHVWIMVSYLLNKSIHKMYFKYSEYETWKTFCSQQSNEVVIEIQIRFRSNSVVVDTSDWESVYLIRSAMGSMGGNTRDYVNIGNITGTSVEKTMWLVPELVAEKVYQDDISSCFKEATFFNGKEKNRKE